jgi:hypothetical protein
MTQSKEEWCTPVNTIGLLEICSLAERLMGSQEEINSATKMYY